MTAVTSARRRTERHPLRPTRTGRGRLQAAGREEAAAVEPELLRRRLVRVGPRALARQRRRPREPGVGQRPAEGGGGGLRRRQERVGKVG